MWTWALNLPLCGFFFFHNMFLNPTGRLITGGNHASSPREWHSSGVCLTAPSPQSPVFANPNSCAVPNGFVWCSRLMLHQIMSLFVCFLQEFSCKLATVNGELNHSQTWLSNSPKREKNRANWLLRKCTPGITQSDTWGVVAIGERSY